MYRIVFVLLLFSISLPAAARMYQWVDPETGTTQLSGKPPAWYRSGRDGPRVFVFEKGRVVDDTGIEVSDGQRERLRQKALYEAAQDRDQARQQLLEARRMKAMADKQQPEQEEVEETAAPEFLPPPPEMPPESGEMQPEEKQKAEAMRQLVREWEQMRTKDARRVIGAGGDSAAPGPAPPPDQ